MSTPRTGIVIVTYNSRRFFPRLKAALEAQSAPEILELARRFFGEARAAA